MSNEKLDKVNINWFPGHMKKASNLIEEKAKYIDFFIYILDARTINSSMNKYLLNKIKDKKKMFLISKADLASPKENELWQKKLESSDDITLLVDLKNQKSIDLILEKIDLMIESKREKMARKGIKNFAIKAMVIGIPNVGKSTFINLLSRRSLAKAENRPGLTRNITWIKVSKNFELLDTPGILLPKFEKEEDAINLALIGTIKEDILPIDDLFNQLMKIIRNDYIELFKEKYDIDLKNTDDLSMLNELSKKRGYILKNNELDITRCKKVILNDFKNGKLGRITLEKAN